MADYPELITHLPEIDPPAEGIRGWLSQAADHQIVFFELAEGMNIPPHHHGAQWGIVVEGKMELTIDGQTNTYGPGDSYCIPAGAVHGAKFLTKVRAIDVFADSDRYRTR
ncbi:MAG: cupin domain-containing protein [Phycisphaerae bacterium]